MVCYRIGLSFDLPFLVGSGSFFEVGGEGLNDSSFACGSRSFSRGGTFGLPSTRFNYLRHKYDPWVW